MIIYLLIITLIIFLFLIFLVFKNDIMCPPFVVCSMFVFSTICAIYNIDTWNIYLHWNTYFVICGGIALYSFISWVVYIFFYYKDREVGVTYTTPDKNEIKEIKIKKIWIFLFIFITICIGGLYIKYIYLISSKYGLADTWLNTMKTYRESVSYGILSEEDVMPRLITWGYLLITSSGFLWIYLAVNNFLALKRINKLLCFEIFLCLMMSLLSAGRVQFIQYIIAIFCDYYILLRRKNGWKSNIGPKFIFKCLVSFCIVLSLFSGLRTVVGRASTQDPVSYVTSYLGGSIELLDMFMQDRPTQSDIFGKETFYELNKFIGRKFDKPELIYVGHKEFRYANGICIGNVYTAFRNYIYDFGYSGLLVLVSISSAIFSFIYNVLKRKRNKGRIDILLIMYSYLFYSIFLMSYADYFYEMCISLNTIKVFFIIMVLKYMIIGIQTKKID